MLDRRGQVNPNIILCTGPNLRLFQALEGLDDHTWCPETALRWAVVVVWGVPAHCCPVVVTETRCGGTAGQEGSEGAAENRAVRSQSRMEGSRAESNLSLEWKGKEKCSCAWEGEWAPVWISSP